ncbi:hypothetical protein [Liquorilactobacillus hordei]|uniref:hypothetical protein n=1 Tax=Liquorilactobacillus hordei TaxID=468911 RepID=UPI00268342F6
MNNYEFITVISNYKFYTDANTRQVIQQQFPSKRQREYRLSSSDFIEFLNYLSLYNYHTNSKKILTLLSKKYLNIGNQIIK